MCAPCSVGRTIMGTHAETVSEFIGVGESWDAGAAPEEQEGLFWTAFGSERRRTAVRPYCQATSQAGNHLLSLRDPDAVASGPPSPDEHRRSSTILTQFLVLRHPQTPVPPNHEQERF